MRSSGIGSVPFSPSNVDMIGLACIDCFRTKLGSAVDENANMDQAKIACFHRRGAITAGASSFATALSPRGSLTVVRLSPLRE